MKRKALLILMIVVFSMISVFTAYAATTADISVTVTLENISISISSGTWAIGVVAAESVNTSAAYTVTNNGNVAEDVAIQTGDSTNWTSEAAVGVNQFVMDAQGGDLGVLAWTNIDASQNLKLGLAVSGTVADLSLRFTVPSAGSNVTQQTVTVTLTASKS